MTFLLTTLFLLFFHLAAALRSAWRHEYALAAAHFFLLLCCRLALDGRVLGETLLPEPAQQGKPLVFLLRCMVVPSIMLLGMRLARIVRAGDTSPALWRTGLHIWGLAACCYQVAALQDHMAFTLGKAAHVVDASRLGIKDVACSGPVLARLERDGVARYRCPRMVVWNGNTDDPFIPWPAYGEGTSTALAAALSPAPARRIAERKARRNR